MWCSAPTYSATHFTGSFIVIPAGSVGRVLKGTRPWAISVGSFLGFYYILQDYAILEFL